MDLQQWRNRKRTLRQPKPGGIAPPILKEQRTRPSQRILETFVELVESGMENCKRATNMVKLYHRDRDLQMQRVYNLR